MKRSRGSEQSARNNGHESNNRFIERDALSRQLRGVAGGDRVPSPTVTFKNIEMCNKRNNQKENEPLHEPGRP
ncbi:hypothetical protein KGM_201290 [Danaus plexippus plexippus]|uniref:Uncharacterized protein n=1 Tax=Danaus plexippus plexippus TaxID=278856 RepID=A0A212FHR6_DANPL|nr:hypothetical protein KGM_201290 [Danaus plexippus plexippus]